MGFLDELEKVVGTVATQAMAQQGGTAPQYGQPSQTTAPGAAAAGGNLIAQEAMRLLTDNSSGGLNGLVQQFEQQGLGHLIGSWVGSGQNLPVSGQQLAGVLGDQRVQELAQRVGLPPAAAASALAAVLPALVDHMTPNGNIEQQLLQQGLSWLQSRAG
jgi:uncharacterized protein YidB (DUF937 family)